MPAIARLLDANVNRAREALRVIEDLARFALDEPDVSGEAKQLRHELRTAIDSLDAPPGWLEFNRDTPGDVGTAFTTSSEMRRESLHDIAVAAGKRLGEAFRVLEEAGKVIDPAFAATIKSLRYRAYDLESRLLLRLGAGRTQQWSLCLLLTQSLCLLPWRDVLRQAMEGGADCIQVREKSMDGGCLADHVLEVVAITRPRGVSVIVNDCADVAVAAGADGVHLGQRDLSVRDVRRVAGRALLVGVSTHNAQEAAAAVAAGADYCGVGAMFPTALKADREPAGPSLVAAFVSRHPETPHLAIGGIAPDNVAEVVAAGARGIAVSSAICGAPDPRSAAATLRSIVADRGASLTPVG
jgi:thiamine-phosphate pyrophosphorylase